MPKGDLSEAGRVAVRKLDPEREPSRGWCPGPGREQAFQERGHPAVLRPDLAAARPADGVDPAEELDRSELRKDRTAQVGQDLQPRQPREDRLGRADPADPQAPPENLRERADRQNRSGPRECGDGRGRLGAERQVCERVVLDERNVRLVRDARDLAPHRLGHERAGRVVKRRHEIGQPRRRAMNDFAEGFRAHSAPADRKRNEVGARVGEDVHRPEVGRRFERHGIAFLEEKLRDETDRLLGAARDEDLILARRQPSRVQPSRDRAAQLRKTGRQVTVVSCEPRDSLFQRDELSGDCAGPRKVRAQKLDRSAGALDQAPVHGVPSKRRRLVAGRRRATRRRAHTRAASLPGLEPAFLAKGFVRGHHRRPADGEQAREVSLRRDATSRLEVASQDCRAQAVRETPVHRTGGLRPGAERIDEVEFRRRPSGHCARRERIREGMAQSTFSKVAIDSIKAGADAAAVDGIR